MPEVIGIHRRTVPAAEDELAVALGREAVQRRLERRCHVDGAPGAPGLRRTELAMPQRSADVNPMAVEVDVAPLQPEELALTHPGERGGPEQRFERLLLGLQQAPDLRRG